MKRIDSTTIYTGEELHSLLLGVIKVERLRQFGLIGSPGSGYWGQNIIDSLNQYWDNLVHQRTGKVREEDHLDSKNQTQIPKEKALENRKLHASSRRAGQLESERERFRRNLSESSL